MCIARCGPQFMPADNPVLSKKERTVRIGESPEHDLQGQTWFAMDFEGGLPAGRWICLHYRTTLLGDAQRPFLRLRSKGAEQQVPMPAGLFGRAEWVGYLPSDLADVAVSSAILGTPSYRTLSICAVFRRGLVRNRLSALHALRLWSTGRRAEAWNELLVACKSTPLEDYHRWRAKSLREPDPEGLDAPPENWLTGPHVRAIVEAGPTDAVERTLTSLEHQLYPRRSVRVAEREKLNGDPSGLLADLDDRDIVTVLRPGDVLPPYAFATVANYMAGYPDADLVYGDEESIDARGRYVDPQLKPDWSPIFQAMRPYVGRAVYGRRDLAAAGLGKPWPPLPEATKSIRHIRRVLLTKAVANEEAAIAGGRSHRAVLADHAAAPAPATIVIPSSNRADLLLACLRSLRATQATFEVLVVDNGQDQAVTAAECQAAVGDHPIRVLPMPGPFNFSRLCNEAAAVARGQVLAFLNDDTVATQPDWLVRLSAWATRAECGAIGPKLVYPSGLVQHGGIVVGLGGYAAHIESGAPGDHSGYDERLLVTHEVSAVTGACLVVEKKKFDAVGGFDADRFPVELGDVDLCLRLERKGWKTALVPEVSLVHHESATRGRTDHGEVRYSWEKAHFARLWQARIRDDPFFHPAFSLISPRTRLDG